MGGETGTEGTTQTLEERTKEYVACPSCNKKSALSNKPGFAEQITCYNPKCKTYEPPKAMIDVPFNNAISFLQHCINTGPSGFYKNYIKGIIRLTKKVEKKYSLA
jgi:hypothetical protein